MTLDENEKASEELNELMKEIEIFLNDFINSRKNTLENNSVLVLSIIFSSFNMMDWGIKIINEKIPDENVKKSFEEMLREGFQSRLEQIDIVFGK